MAVHRQTATRWVYAGEGALPLLEKALALSVIATVFFLPTSEALKNIFFVVSLALCVAVIFTGRERIVVPPVGWLFISFLGAAILSAAVSPYPWKAITGVWGVFRYTSFFFIVQRALQRGKQVRAVCWAAISGLGLTALVTLFDYVQRVPSDAGIDALSLGGNDSAALYAVMGLALIFGLYVHTDIGGWAFIWLITVAGLSVVLLGVTHTRALWIGFVLVILILGWLRSARVAIMAVAVFVLVVLGLAARDPGINREVVLLLGRSAGVKGAIQLRRELGKKAIVMWRDAPWLGVGPKTFNLHDDAAHNPQRSKYDSRHGHPHNLWLLTAVEMGSVGSLILLVMFVYIGFWLIRWRKRFPSSWPAAVWDGAFGSWMAIMIGSLTEPDFGREAAMFFFMLLALAHVGFTDGKGSHEVP